MEGGDIGHACLKFAATAAMPVAQILFTPPLFAVPDDVARRRCFRASTLFMMRWLLRDTRQPDRDYVVATASAIDST
jgi:hypothetical protein